MIEWTTFEQFRKRPGMFVGGTDLKSIRSFLDGYSFAMQLYNMEALANDPFAQLAPSGFHDWVAYRLRYTESTSGWDNMITEKADSESNALRLFFKLSDEFHHRKPHLVAKLVGYDKTYRVTERLNDDATPVEREELRRFPQSVSLITYTDDPGFFAYSDTELPLPCVNFFPTFADFERRTGATWDRLTIVDRNWSPERGVKR